MKYEHNECNGCDNWFGETLVVPRFEEFFLVATNLLK